MEKKKINLRSGLIILMIIMAALSRLLPHPPNFTPVGAMALFGASYFYRKYFAVIIPIIAIWISSLFLNNLVYAKMYPETYDGFVWFSHPWVYVGFIMIAILGFITLKKIRPTNLLITSILASVIFFLVTNFGFWMEGMMYPKTFTGLMAAYTAGLPFFWNTLLGDLIYVTALFGSFEMITRNVPAFQKAVIRN